MSNLPSQEAGKYPPCFFFNQLSLKSRDALAKPERKSDSKYCDKRSKYKDVVENKFVCLYIGQNVFWLDKYKLTFQESIDLAHIYLSIYLSIFVFIRISLFYLLIFLGFMAKVLDSGIIVSELELQLRY